MALRKLFGKSVELDKLPAELKALLEEMKKERNAFETLSVRSQGTFKRAEELAEPVAKAQEQVNALKERLAAVDSILSQATALQAQLAGIADGQRVTQADLAKTTSDAQKTRTELTELRTMLAEALELKNQLAGFLEAGKRFKELDAQLRDMAPRFEQMRSENADAASRLEAFQEEWRKVLAGAETVSARVEKFEQTAQQLQDLLTEIPNVKHELGTLKALADYVSQKMLTLEGQRDAVEGATRGAERLAELVNRVDRELQQQQTNVKFLSKLQESVDELKKMHDPLLQQSEEIQERQKAIEAEARTRREEFTSLAEDMQKAFSTFAFDRDGLEAVSQRIAELREGLSTVEKRLPELDQMRGVLEGAESTAERLVARVDALVPHVTQLEADAARLRAAAQEGDRAGRMLQEFEEHAKAFEEARTRLARFETQVAELLAAEERVGRSLALAAERQAAVDAVRSELQRLFEIADATVQQVRAVAALQQEIAERRKTLDSVVSELEELGRQGKALEERKKQFEEAEERVSRLDALLIDVKSTLQTVLDQKEFLEKVVETAGTLAFQTMQAEGVIAQLRAERDQPR